MKRKIFSLLLSICLIMTMMPSMAFATGEGTAAVTTLDITAGSIVVTDEGYQQGSNALVKWTSDNHTLKVTGTFDGTASGVTEARMIDVQGGNPVIQLENVTLKQNKSSDVQHAAYMAPAVLLEAEQTATISALTANTLEGGYQAPAIQVNRDAVLTIEGQGVSAGQNQTLKGGNGDCTAIGAGSASTTYAEADDVSGGNLVVNEAILMLYSAGTSNAGNSSNSTFGDIVLTDTLLRGYGSTNATIYTNGKLKVTSSKIVTGYGVYAKGGYDESIATYAGTGSGATAANMVQISQEVEGDGRIDTWRCRRESRNATAFGIPNTGSHLTSLKATYVDESTNEEAETRITSGGSFAMPAYPVTVKAVFEKNVYKVTYYANDGTDTYATSGHTYDVEQVLRGNTFTREGYTFDSWNTKEDGTGTCYTDRQKVVNLSETHNANVPLYAQWTADKSTVTYISGGAEYESKEVTYDSPYNLPQTPSVSPSADKPRFVGWFTAAEGGEQVTADTVVKTTEDHTLYAQWAEKIDLSINEAPQTYTYGDESTAFAVKDAATNGFTVEYYVNNAWTKTVPANAGSYDVKVTRAEDANYAAFRTEIPAGLVIEKAAVEETAVTVEAPEATKVPALTAETAEGANYTVKSVSWAPADAAFDYDTAYTVSVALEAKANYAFAENATAKVNDKTATVKLVDGVLTVTYTFAKTEKEIHTITFMNGGTKVAEKKVTDGEALTDIPAVPEKTGYTGAWDKTDFTNIKASATVKTVYTANAYSVKYDANGGAGTTTASSHTYDTEKALTKNGFVKEGYTFAGWNTKADGKGTAYADQAKVKNLTATAGGTVTLYAQWKVNKYTVTYMNGDVTFDSKEVTYDGKYVLPEATPEKTGENFKGWFTAAEGGQQVTAATTVKTADDHSLYAQWTDKLVITIDTAVQTFTYGDEKIAFAVKEAAEEDFTVEYLVGEDWTAEAPVNVGSYDVKVTRAEDDTYAEFAVTIEKGLVIEKAEVAETAVTVGAPVATEVPAATAAVAEGANYTVKSVSWTPADETFAYDTAYTVTIVLEAKANYAFAEAAAVTVNGESAEAELVDGVLTVTYEFAKTAKEVHTITFMNGAAVVAVKEVTNGETLKDIPAVPAKAGYTGAWDVKDFTNVKADRTVKAVYTPVTYTITYGGVAGAVNSNPATYTIESAAITLTAPAKAGYVFTGWTYAGQTAPVKTVVIPKGSMGNKAYTANFMMIPTAPAKVTTALYGYDDIKVTWSAATGATSYQVYMKKGSGAYKLATTTSSLTYKAKNLADGAKYTFKVVAYNGTLAGGEKASSAIYTLKKVTGVKVVKSGSKVKVSWKNIQGETGYQISKMTTKKGTQKKPTTYKTTKGKYKKLAAAKGKTYYYKVRAYKQVGKTKIYGPWSAVKKFKRK